MVALVHAFATARGVEADPRTLAAEAIRLEQKIAGAPVGCQDQIASAFGGLNLIGFPKEGAFTVTPVAMEAPRQDALQERLLLLFTGITRTAAPVEQAKVDNFAQRRAELARMRDIAIEGASLLADARTDLDGFGRLLDETWRLKRRLADAVSNSSIDSAVETGLKAGALGGKLLGAGGGGYVLFYAPPERHAAIEAALPAMKPLRFAFEAQGSMLQKER
jgi:D-glycero-alpha-D-manno-heptose-7-phosphate kinase